ncbi:unnamed protein product, partial [marine sediment metagenome]
MENDNSARELFLKVMNFESCNRTLKWEFGYWTKTLNRWYKEGLPKVKGLQREIVNGEYVIGSDVHAEALVWPQYQLSDPNSCLRDSDVSNYFNFDEGYIAFPYNYWLFPLFKEKVIYEDERYIELYGEDGIRI